MNTSLDQLTAADLRRAADITEKIESLQAELEQILSGGKRAGKRAGAKARRKPRVAKRKATKAKAAKKKVAKKKVTKRKAKRSPSAAARKAMSDARKAYWANKRKEEAK